MTLLWFEDEEVPPPKPREYEQSEEPLLEELDGNLRWPGKSGAGERRGLIRSRWFLDACDGM